ncbi:unnamed protein product [Paramecium primaurelia]|uniref:SAC domain-containing protein n=1 Tax=Paramecium primaurelia TaxID=5886 RepID=A0A8S1JP43_PARPR|nr:unnamed protein product [Paramecium primaurelia]
MNLEYPWDVQKIKFKNIQVFRSHQKEKYILIGNHTLSQQFCILHLNILKGPDLYQKELKQYIYEEERQFETLEDAKQYLNKYNLTYLYTVSGIIGFIKLVQGYYVMFIKRRKSIAKLGKHKIFTIEERSIVELFDGPYSQIESKYKKLLQDYDLEIGFYSSYTYDATSSLSKNIIPSEDVQNKNQKYHQIGQYRNLFMWNHYLLAEFDKIIKDKRWVIPIIHGYCEQSTIKTVANYFSITLLARRSTKHAGARYLTRGINEQGYVANFVETEQIVIELDKSTCQRPACSSFIQIRGSAPVYWYQEPKMYLFKLPIKIHQSDPYLYATKKHFCDLISSYGRQIYMVNLVKQNEHNKREQVLAEEYFSAINNVKDEMQSQTEIEIGYLGFDMKAQLKQDKEEFVNKCYSLAYYCIMKTGVFLFVKEPKCNENVIIEIQNGVVRSNCVDCLDRTNTFQQLIGEMALGIQLAKINQSSLKFNLLLLNESILQEFREMYEQLGDFVSQQYGSSLAHKQNIGQKSKRIELFTSLKRHYNNNIEDPQKQNQIDLFLGIHRPSPDGPFIGERITIFLFPDTKYLQQYTQHKQWWVNPYLEFQQKSLIDEISRRCKEACQQAKKDQKMKIERKQTIFNFDIIEKMKHKANQKLKGKNVFILSSPYTKVREKPPNYVSKPFNLEEKLKKPYYDVIQIYEAEEEGDSPCDSHHSSPKLNSQNLKTRFSLLKGNEILEIEKYTRIKTFDELTDEANQIRKYLKYNLSSDDEEKLRNNLKRYLNGEQPKEQVALIDKNQDIQKQYSEVQKSIANSETVQDISIQQTKKIPVEQKSVKFLESLLKKNFAQSQKLKINKI